MFSAVFPKKREQPTTEKQQARRLGNGRDEQHVVARSAVVLDEEVSILPVPGRVDEGVVGQPVEEPGGETRETENARAARLRFAVSSPIWLWKPG